MWCRWALDFGADVAEQAIDGQAISYGRSFVKGAFGILTAGMSAKMVVQAPVGTTFSWSYLLKEAKNINPWEYIFEGFGVGLDLTVDNWFSTRVRQK